MKQLTHQSAIFHFSCKEKAGITQTWGEEKGRNSALNSSQALGCQSDIHHFFFVSNTDFLQRTLKATSVYLSMCLKGQCYIHITKFCFHKHKHRVVFPHAAPTKLLSALVLHCRIFPQDTVSFSAFLIRVCVCVYVYCRCC